MLVLVIRPFMLDGRVCPAGSRVDLPDDMAGDLIARQRVEPAQVIAPVSGPMMTTNTPALVRAPRLKGRKHHAQ